jgi:hypothetical protein
MSGKTAIYIVVGAIVLILLGGAYWLVQSKLGTKLEKTLLKFSGGEFTVSAYVAGSNKPVKTWEGKGYVWFEQDKNDRHTGVVTFKTKEGHLVRIGAWGGLVIVEYK